MISAMVRAESLAACDAARAQLAAREVAVVLQVAPEMGNIGIGG